MSRIDDYVKILTRFDVKPSYSQTAVYNASIEGFRKTLARRIYEVGQPIGENINVCSGCGHVEGDDLEGHMGCCPDNRHIPIRQFIDEEFHPKIDAWWLMQKIKDCDELGGMEKEKWAFQQCLKLLKEEGR